MWRRSVSRRSPPTSASTRAGNPATVAASSTAAMPRAVDSSTQLRSVSATSSVRSSPWASSSAAVRPKKQVSAADRTLTLRCGCSSASSRHSHSTAAGVAKTSRRRRSRRARRPPATLAAGAAASRWPRSPRCRGAAAPAPRTSHPTRAAAYVAARSSAIRGRTSLIGRVLEPLAEVLARDHPQPQRAVRGAPTSRCRRWCASTGRTTIRVAERGAARAARAAAHQRRVAAVVGAERDSASARSRRRRGR